MFISIAHMVYLRLHHEWGKLVYQARHSLTLQKTFPEGERVSGLTLSGG